MTDPVSVAITLGQSAWKLKTIIDQVSTKCRAHSGRGSNTCAVASKEREEYIQARIQFDYPNPWSRGTEKQTRKRWNAGAWQLAVKFIRVCSLAMLKSYVLTDITPGILTRLFWVARNLLNENLCGREFLVYSLPMMSRTKSRIWGPRLTLCRTDS